MIKDQIHQKIIRHYNKVQDWFAHKRNQLEFPFYSSFDLRDSSQKIAPVDANLFPAGFNNICEVDRNNADRLVAHYLKNHHSSAQTIALLAEEHTHNSFYWDNIYSLKTLLEKSGPIDVMVCVPGKNFLQDCVLTTARGRKLNIFLLKNKKPSIDLIISNNDFSTHYDLNCKIPIIPSPEQGWRERKKHNFFDQYNFLAREFADLIEVSDFSLTIQTHRFTEFNIDDMQSLKRLKQGVDLSIKKLKPFYQKLNQKPFLFLKNNSGTYGLGMTTIQSSEDISRWNYKIKKKMKASKGGRKITELIIQEGILSQLQTKGAVAEPVIYLIGSHLAGGFLRTHKNKKAVDNLNSPGAVYRTLCISDLEIEVEGKPMENVYGWIAHLGALALAYEWKALKNKKQSG